MLPEVQVGGLTVDTYAAVYVIGIVLAAMFAYHRLQRLGARQRDVLLATALIFAGGALGAAVGVQAVVWLERIVHPDRVSDWGGNSVLGVLAGGVLVAVLCCRHYRVPVGRAFDLGGLPVPLAQAIGRIGCLAAGCCYGRATDSWLGIYLPGEAHVWQVRYPTQLLSAASDLFIFVALLVVERLGNGRLRAAGQADPRRTWPFNGFLFLLFALLYCLKRLGMEFLRGDALPPLWGSLNLVQLLCLAGAVVSAAFIIVNSTPRRKGYMDRFHCALASTETQRKHTKTKPMGGGGPTYPRNDTKGREAAHR